MNLNVADPNGLPLDLTGYTVSMSMKKSFHAKKRIDFVVEIVDAIKGKVKVSLDETVTALIPAIHTRRCNGTVTPLNHTFTYGPFCTPR
jgi:hypothetical protein